MSYIGSIWFSWWGCTIARSPNFEKITNFQNFEEQCFKGFDKEWDDLQELLEPSTNDNLLIEEYTFR
jgi:hypothetical protein